VTGSMALREGSSKACVRGGGPVDPKGGGLLLCVWLCACGCVLGVRACVRVAACVLAWLCATWSLGPWVLVSGLRRNTSQFPHRTRSVGHHGRRG
jgi:hypothetical protein